MVKKENIKNMEKIDIILSCEFKEIPGTNLFDVCKKYLFSLLDLVTECEKKFKNIEYHRDGC